MSPDKFPFQVPAIDAAVTNISSSGDDIALFSFLTAVNS